MLSKKKMSFWRIIKPFINSRNNENTGSRKLKDNDESDDEMMKAR